MQLHVQCARLLSSFASLINRILNCRRSARRFPQTHNFIAHQSKVRQKSVACKRIFYFFLSWNFYREYSVYILKENFPRYLTYSSLNTRKKIILSLILLHFHLF